jgi:hypothetical protein
LLPVRAVRPAITNKTKAARCLLAFILFSLVEVG